MLGRKMGLVVLLLMATVGFGSAAWAGNELKACIRAVSKFEKSWSGAVNKDRKRLHLTNNCGFDVFVVYCWKRNKFKSGKSCGDYVRDKTKGSFYTHSQNLAPGEEKSFHHDGNGEAILYGLCKGTVGFGKPVKDYPNGHYTCSKPNANKQRAPEAQRKKQCKREQVFPRRSRDWAMFRCRDCSTKRYRTTRGARGQELYEGMTLGNALAHACDGAPRRLAKNAQKRRLRNNARRQKRKPTYREKGERARRQKRQRARRERLKRAKRENRQRAKREKKSHTSTADEKKPQAPQAIATQSALRRPKVARLPRPSPVRAPARAPGRVPQGSRSSGHGAPLIPQAEVSAGDWLSVARASSA
jgi:hypothetical protein